MIAAAERVQLIVTALSRGVFARDPLFTPRPVHQPAPQVRIIAPPTEQHHVVNWNAYYARKSTERKAAAMGISLREYHRLKWEKQKASAAKRGRIKLKSLTRSRHAHSTSEGADRIRT